MNDFIKDENLNLILTEKQKFILLLPQIINTIICIIQYSKLLWDN